MALLVCTKCTTAYTVGAPACPHCGGRKNVEEGSKEHLAMLAAVDKAKPSQTGEVTADA